MKDVNNVYCDFPNAEASGANRPHKVGLFLGWLGGKSVRKWLRTTASPY